MRTNPARLLVIEDNPGDVVLLRFALDQLQDPYELELLRDGAAAIEFVQAQRAHSDPEPCVIVLDLNLPKEDGISVLRAIKQQPVLAHIHVVALSSFVNPSDETEVQRLGARLYRAKPMHLDDWLILGREIIAICRESIPVPA